MSDKLLPTGSPPAPPDVTPPAPPDAPPTVAPEVRRRRAELVRRIARLDGAADAAEVFAQASPRLRQFVAFDAAAWMATDPATGLPIAPTRIENMDAAEPSHCLLLWEREHLTPDLNLYRDLARADRPAAALRHRAGDPTASPRYREFVAPLGFDDELRAVLRVDGVPWGTVALMRRQGRAPFTAAETALVASLSEPLGEALRQRARRPATTGHRRPDRPGLLLFDAEATLVSANEEAQGWLAELPASPTLPTDLGIGVPLWMAAVVYRARALAAAPDGAGSARVRIRSAAGTWLVCHGSCLRAADGAVTTTAVVLEPAKAAEIAPIVVQAYDLSEREQQVTRLLARGLGTADIAAELFLSPHTVRDHVKAVLHKVGVSSRGELVAKLFAEHYWPEHADGLVVRVNDG